MPFNEICISELPDLTTKASQSFDISLPHPISVSDHFNWSSYFGLTALGHLLLLLSVQSMVFLSQREPDETLNSHVTRITVAARIAVIGLHLTLVTVRMLQL